MSLGRGGSASRGTGATRRDETRRIVGLYINFCTVRSRKSRVYLAESSSPMSDSYVNDIRYTALWRPVVKARVAPAASLSSPLPPRFSRSVRLFLLFLRDFANDDAEPPIPFSISLPQDSPRRFSANGRARATTVLQAGSNAGMRTTANSICLDGENVCFCRGGRPQQLRPALPLRAQQLCVRSRATRCRLYGHTTLCRSFTVYLYT